MSGQRLAASLLILAGGRSRRMGTPKALLSAGLSGSPTLIEMVVGRLAGEFAEVLIAGPPDLVPPSLHAHLVEDLHAGAGPLAGLEAGLAATRHGRVFALATDMPAIDGATARRLLEAATGHDAAVPRLEGSPQPLAAVYATSAAGPIAAALGAGRLAVREVLAELDVAYVDGLDPALFENLNTPDDYRRFLDALRQKG